MPRSDDDSEDDDRPRRRRRRRDDDYDDDEDDDDRPRRRRSDDVDPVAFIVPTDVSVWSILSCYVGLIGCFLPIIGAVLAIFALACGIVALRKRKKATSYGRVTSDLRAIIGIILASVTLLGYLALVVYLLVKGPK